MAKEEKNIKLSLDTNEIALLVGNICSECYGVVGLADYRSIKKRIVLLRKNKVINGILVTNDKYGFSCEVHLICAYGVKITEIVNEVSKRVSYVLKKKYGELFNKLSVYVEELREL